MSAPRKVVVVVPFLNEEESLPVLYDRLRGVLEKEPEDFELLLVDDGSRDGSAAWAAACAERDPRVRLLSLSRNFGHQLAITAGMDHADGDAVVIMDADLQDPPEVVPELLRRWREGHEVVYAVRTSRHGESWTKRLLAATFYKTFRRMANVDVPLDAGDFRLVDRQVIDALKQVRELHRFVRGLTCWVGFSQSAVHYERAPRHAGATKYPVWKSTRLAWDAITSFSSTPLRWMTVIGLVVSLAGLAPGGPRGRRPAPLPGVDGAGLGLRGRDHALPRRRPARLARPDRPVRRPHLRGEQEAAALLRPEEGRPLPRRAPGELTPGSRAPQSIGAERPPRARRRSPSRMPAV